MFEQTIRNLKNKQSICNLINRKQFLNRGMIRERQTYNAGAPQRKYLFTLIFTGFS